jgi:hypothetical protein
LCCILAPITGLYYYMLIVYLAGLITAILFFRKFHSLPGLLSNILYQFVRDILTTFSMLFFYPGKADIRYERVR